VVIVTQEDHVFIGSLADNVRLGREDATQAQIERALDVVGALPWVSRLPQGAQTQVGAGGTELTPTQAQQLALARVVVKDPLLVVLDEATAMFDGSQGHTVDRALNEILAGRTVVTVAHRLDTARLADRILVVADGRIVESGSHTELMAHEGSYARMWDRWSGSRPRLPDAVEVLEG
jgi:ABC-type multidrug transport system fused ATPase/permease subunit